MTFDSSSSFFPLGGISAIKKTLIQAAEFYDKPHSSASALTHQVGIIPPQSQLGIPR
ncbi:Protein Translation Initiation Factor 2 subunit beta (IF-2b) [Giardia duodenalis]|uniref:Protein Translation Initiation Factor 2 subunit beta (IF-2b) n=1 Tax=Giardia intestinalis TaxID=5741 RepID=V6TUU4_GIAIN|nr:Protein Translation Initiation Factor 2 subunit beta (IF-2b) [Giardia intestinalis]